MKRKCLAKEVCPLARAYDAVGDWWSLLIITRIVIFHDRRFCEIQQSLGMARNILTARLRTLVDHGILEKVPASDGSAYHDYVATERGRDLFRVLVTLRQWGEKHFVKAERCGNRLVDRSTGRPIPPVQVRSDDGRDLSADDLQVVSTAPAARPTTGKPAGKA